MTDYSHITPTPESALDPEFVKLCRSITAKRARTVIDHILMHGIITNDDLSQTYGYNHPPRAIRDVRENGIPIVTHSVASKTASRSIGAYTFGSLSDIKHGRIGGRRAFSKAFKDLLVKHYGSRDAFTGETLNPRYLQIDHRIPYQVAGDIAHAEKPAEFMLIDASSQRAKSWSCEHCENWLRISDPNICRACFWAFPESYNHIAMQPFRRLDIMWQGKDTDIYDVLQRAAEASNETLQEYMKRLLKELHKPRR